MKIDVENQNWITEFKKKNGRAPRVLHIGNIANNAYVNSKLMREAGLESDVLCYDYYHIMGCPEWEEVSFDEFIDHFNPDWSSIKMNGFKRPHWFVQGPLQVCLQYLKKKRGYKGDLVRLYKEFCHDSKLNKHSRLTDNYPFFSYFFKIPQYLKSKYYALNKKIMRNLFKLNVYHTKTEIKEKKRVAELVARWHAAFPNRDDFLTGSDFEFFFPDEKKWSKVLSTYDFVLGYSTDPFIPLVYGIPYFAFEHGTIRDIPYQADSQGRRTALAYHEAEHVFVTNIDCLTSAEYLASGKYTFINHPYDEDQGLDNLEFQEMRTRLLTQLDSDFLFFFPTRHDWIKGKGFADKGNDIFLKAMGELRRAGLKVGAVCCKWGANIQESQDLIATEGLQQHVLWTNPLPFIKFQQMARASDVVVDQFILGAFGGVFYKSMAAGVAVLTYLNESLLQDYYPEIPPMINCKTSEDIFNRVSELYHHPDLLKKIGQDARAWIKKYHTKETTLNLQLKQFGHYFKKNMYDQN